MGTGRSSRRPWSETDVVQKQGRLGSVVALVGNDLTISELGERFITEHMPHRYKPSTADDYRRMIRNTIGKSWIANTKLAALTREDVVRFHRELGSRPPLANRTVKLLGTMLNYAAFWGLTEKGGYLCRIDLYRERGRERFLRSDEIKCLGKTLDDLEREQCESPHVVAAIRLLLLTGARPSEILTLRWSQVDYDRAMLHLPDSKTGPRVIYLSWTAIDVLCRIPQDAGNPFVIHGGIPGQHRVTLERPWQRIRARAGLKDVRLYDLRHTYASVAAGVGLSLPVIGRLLGHKKFETTSRYAHLAAEPLHLATDFIGDELAGALRGDNPSGIARWRLPGRGCPSISEPY